MNSAKLAVSLGAVTLALTGITASAATNVVSDPVGFYKIAINPGANSISVPLPNISAFKGTVASVSGDIITFSGTPGFTANQFAPAVLGASMTPRAQYLVIICKDADKAEGAPDNTAGDWWLVQANSISSVTVANGGDTISAFVAPNDVVEIRKLTSLADMFGDGPNYILTPDVDGFADPGTTDVINIWSGSGINETFSFLTGQGLGFNGYQNATLGDFGLNGAQITLLPNQAMLVFRTPASGVTNACVLGQVQTKRFTHYLVEGPNAIGNPLAGAGQVASSNLRETMGWVDDVDGFQDPATADILNRFSGTGIDLTMSYISGQGPSFDGWFDGNNFQSTQTLDPTRAYLVFIKPGTGSRRWRQNVPY